ncbi:MAG: multidrug transporter, partial [Candidatus Nanopelagicales bacterium]|nr:multidrug transporter [Candidatus Nanopelagicales bacterium]
RVSILRSQFVHNHLVVSNSEVSGGGWPTFAARGEQNDYLPTWLQAAGVTTALIGKFLNEYPSGKITEVSPGWNTWVVPTVEKKGGKPWQAYTGYNYTLNFNGKLREYGSKPTDFLTDVLTQQATDFIATATSPFFLELATFSPHDPAPIADHHSQDHLFTAVPRTPSLNVAGIGEAQWLSQFPVFPDQRIAKFDKLWQQRARSAESVADAVDSVLATLATTGHSDDTLVVFTSDNGFHAGVHRLPKGKRTAYQEDTVVPMVLIGAGIPPGTKVDAMTSTVDFGVTFAKVLGAQSPTWADGRDLTPFFTGQRPASWRTGVISESMGKSLPSDPDYSTFSPPSFTALRTEKWLYTEYADGGIELFDRAMDPYEMHNIASTANSTLMNQLHSQLQALHTCGGATCLVADSMSN